MRPRRDVPRPAGRRRPFLAIRARTHSARRSRRARALPRHRTDRWWPPTTTVPASACSRLLEDHRHGPRERAPFLAVLRESFAARVCHAVIAPWTAVLDLFL